MNEDELKILKMIEAGTITADEGMKLLEAIGSGDKKRQNTQNTQNTPKKTLRVIRLNIFDEHKNNQVDIKLPLALFKAGVKIGEKFSPDLQSVMEEINYDEILKSINEGATGEITTIKTHDGHSIQIFFE